ncbi:cyclin-J18 [Beta vulgaris subsp. vulgaris]|nr:cyclin-J18 [Beta vulgaris subsp. vulgaris]
MTNTEEENSLASSLRLEAVKFLIQCAEQLKLSPIVKYSALSLFALRFISSLSSSRHNHWLLKKPLNFPHLQLFSLISLWIASKTYDSPPLSLKSLKSIGDQFIKDQHFTKTDYLDAEIVFLRSLNFEVGTMKNSTFLVLQELMMKLKEVAKVGEMVSFEACCDVMDLIYESDDISRMFVESPVYLAAGVLVAVYSMTVPKQRCEFPVVGWVNFVTGCREEDVVLVVKLILQHVVG